MTRLHGWTCALALILAAGLGGCATYVNIPPLEGDVAAHDANASNVQEVAVAALTAVITERPVPGPVHVILPPGTREQVYVQTVPKIGAIATWSRERPPADAVILEARQIRIRGWRAQVDIIRPADYAQPAALQQLVTVDLKQDLFKGWRVERLNMWRTRVEEALRMSTYGPVGPSSP